MDQLQLKLCDIQGRLFELSGNSGYGSNEFIKAFMSSNVAKGLDSSFNRYQWAGEEYLLEETADECQLEKGGSIYFGEVLYWTGYIYRFWHFYKGSDSSKIIKAAPPETMNRNFTMFHSMDPEMAVDDLIEIKNQKST